MPFGIKKLFKKISQSDNQDIEKIALADPELTGSSDSINKSVTALSKSEEKSTKIKSAKKEGKNMNNENNNSSAATLKHLFIEVAADLLAKPSALCDLVEAQGGKSVLVFCNNPSDTDFVEVILKKRGISAVKLIGFVAPEKLEKTQERVKSGELAAVVITDVAARGLDFGLFSVIVNYSLPSDAEAYNNRAAVSHPGNREILSIVSPLDFANFHQLKTSTAYEFLKKEPPSKEELAKSKLLKVKLAAQSKCAVMDPALSALASEISADSESVAIIAYLLQNLFDVVPQLQSQIDKLQWERENREHEEDDMGQDGQSQHLRSGRDRDSRGGGRGQRGGRDRDRRDRNEGGRGRSQPRQASNHDDDYEYDEQPQDRPHRGEESDDNNRRSREDRRPPPPQKIRDDRLYIGRGEKDGLSESKFASLLQEHCGIEKEQLKRFYLRKNYAFADLPEGTGADVVQKLNGLEDKGGSLYVAKATQVITVIENENSQEGSESAAESQFDGDEQPSA